jgi:cytochrome b561
MMTDRYSTVARALHWIIGILVILNIFGGLLHDALEGWPIMPFHKAAGITVLFLTLVRIGRRLTHRAPPLPPEMPAWEKGAAHLTHFLFYLLMLVVPLTGWIMVSPGDRPLNWFGLFPIPKFALSKGDAIVGISGEGHEVLGIAFAVLVVLHVAAALRHHFILKDNVLRRMLA